MALLRRDTVGVRPVNRHLARIQINEACELRKTGTESIANSPMSDLTHVLFVDWIDRDLGRPVCAGR